MILYICDGKNPKCSGKFGCMSECFHTSDPDHARYGTVDINPEWEKERFVDWGWNDLCKDCLLVEKKRW